MCHVFTNVETAMEPIAQYPHRSSIHTHYVVGMRIYGPLVHANGMICTER